MSRKRARPEEVVTDLRRADVLSAQHDQGVTDAIRAPGCSIPAFDGAVPSPRVEGRATGQVHHGGATRQRRSAARRGTSKRA